MKSESELSNALMSEDEIGRVIRTHLYIENLLNDFLKKALTNPCYIKPLKLDFYGKVHLALSLGLPGKFKKPLTYIGKMRNRFAHELHSEIARNEVNNFFEQFSDEQKKDIIDTASMPSLSWASQGAKWKTIEPRSKFMIMCFSLYYGLKMALIEFENEKERNCFFREAGESIVE